MRLDELSDEKLMLSVVGGDQKALEILYDRYAAQVRGLALRLLGERTAAEEIVQETFWRVWSRGKSYDARQAPFKSWMFTIAHHLALDTLRRQKSRPEEELDEANFGNIYHRATRSDEPGEELWQNERRALVQQAVAQLSKEQAEVILLSYFQGLTRQEIAERTQTPLGTVHSRARLALDRLRETLHREGDKVR